jgi:hypothetical protein
MILINWLNLVKIQMKLIFIQQIIERTLSSKQKSRMLCLTVNDAL